MKIIVKNNITIEQPSDDVVEWAERELVVDNPEYQQKVRLGKYVRGTPKVLNLFMWNRGNLVVPFGCFEDIYKLHSVKSDFINEIKPFQRANMSSSIVLLPYQEKAVESLKMAKYGVLQAPCGSGKTIMGLELIKRIGGKALWLTHTHKLLEQSKERAEMFLDGKFGVISDGKVNIGEHITFATIQTMSKLDESVYKDEFSVVVVDECHHACGTPTRMTQFYKVINNCNCMYKFGLSATLKRQDGLIKTVFKLLGNIRHVISACDVEERVIRAAYVPVHLDFEYNKDEYIQPDGTIVYNDLINMLCENKERNKFIIDMVNRLKKERDKIMVLVPRVEQCKMLSEKLNCAGIYGKAKNKSMDGKVIVATFQIAKEGLDLPSLDTLIMTAPVKDEIAVKQSVGRVERKSDGKKQPIVFDLVDNNVSYCKNAFLKRKRIIGKK